MSLVNLSTWPVRRKVMMLIGFAALVMLGGGVAGLAMLRQQALEDRVLGLRWVAESVRAQADALAAEVKAGRLDRAEAIKRIAAQAQAIRFGGENYISLFSTEGVTLAHVNTKLIGTNRMEEETAGIKIVKEYKKGIVEKGSAVVRYLYPRPGRTELIGKIAYAVGHEGLGLIIATGAYTDDVDADFVPVAWRVGGALVAGLLSLGALGWRLGRSIAVPLEQLNDDIARISAGALATEVHGAARRDEIGQMARAVEGFRDQVRENRDLHAERERTATAQLLERKSASARLAGDLRTQVRRVVDGVAEGARDAMTPRGRSTRQSLRCRNRSRASAQPPSRRLRTCRRLQLPRRSLWPR